MAEMTLRQGLSLYSEGTNQNNRINKVSDKKRNKIVPRLLNKQQVDKYRVWVA